jgi:hypothetical protein
MALSVLTVRNIHSGRVRKTEHVNAVEARRELVRLCSAMHCARDGNGHSGTLTAEDGRAIASYELWSSSDQRA